MPANTSANTTNPMKAESTAWQQLRDRASAQLRADFADRVLATTCAPAAEAAAWRRLLAFGAAQLSPGFAARVLAAARTPVVSSFARQFCFSAATAAVCLAAFFVLHERATRSEDAQNLVSWNQIADQAEDLGQFP